MIKQVHDNMKARAFCSHSVWTGCWLILDSGWALRRKYCGFGLPDALHERTFGRMLRKVSKVSLPTRPAASAVSFHEIILSCHPLFFEEMGKRVMKKRQQVNQDERPSTYVSNRRIGDGDPLTQTVSSYARGEIRDGKVRSQLKRVHVLRLLTAGSIQVPVDSFDSRSTRRTSSSIQTTGAAEGNKDRRLDPQQKRHGEDVVFQKIQTPKIAKIVTPHSLDTLQVRQ